MSLRWLHTRTAPLSERLAALRTLQAQPNPPGTFGSHVTQPVEKKCHSFREWAARYDPRRKTA